MGISTHCSDQVALSDAGAINLDQSGQLFRHGVMKAVGDAIDDLHHVGAQILDCQNGVVLEAQNDSAKLVGAATVGSVNVMHAHGDFLNSMGKPRKCDVQLVGGNDAQPGGTDQTLHMNLHLHFLSPLLYYLISLS